MTLSWPSALAAVTSASNPPPALADDCAAQSVDPAVLDEPQADTMRTAAAARPKRWNRCQFMRSSLPSGWMDLPCSVWLGRRSRQGYDAPTLAPTQGTRGRRAAIDLLAAG